MHHKDKWQINMMYSHRACAQFFTGDIANVTLRNLTSSSNERRALLGKAPSSRQQFALVDATLVVNNGPKELYSGKQIRLRSVTYLLDMSECGMKPAATVDVSRRWLAACMHTPACIHTPELRCLRNPLQV